MTAHSNMVSCAATKLNSPLYESHFLTAHQMCHITLYMSASYQISTKWRHDMFDLPQIFCFCRAFVVGFVLLPSHAKHSRDQPVFLRIFGEKVLRLTQFLPDITLAWSVLDNGPSSPTIPYRNLNFRSSQYKLFYA